MRNLSPSHFYAINYDDQTLYKWTQATGNATHGSGTWRKGRWRSVRGALVPCLNGIHLCRERDLSYWINETLWLVEVAAGCDRIDVNDGNSKIVVRRARVIERLDGWSETTARLCAADFAERALPIFERQCPYDDRPRETIGVVRAFARGEAGVDELRTAALDAADAAAYVDAHAAAYAAHAAYAAAHAAAHATAAHAAATHAGAYAAAAAAADAASHVAAHAAERRWQATRILAYATGKLS